jgi:excisionase family DNA binding protein
LVLLGSLPGNREKELHALFGELKLEGEWFKIDPLILDWIQKNVSVNASVFDFLLKNLSSNIAMLPTDASRWFNVKEAAVYVRGTLWQMRTLIRDGKIPYRKVGHGYVLDRMDLDRYLERIRITGPASQNLLRPNEPNPIATGKRNRNAVGRRILSEDQIREIRMKCQ